MFEWWSDLDALAQILFGSAVFFSALLLLQLAFSFEHDSADGHDGDSGDAGDTDAHGDLHDGDASDHDSASHGDYGSAAGALWRGIASRRSIFAFLTLFSWGGALYLQAGRSTLFALGVGAAWGFVGSALVAAIYWGIQFLQDPGGRFALDDSVGEEGTVYLRIPPGGEGQVRVAVGARIRFVRARAAGDDGIAENTPVFVSRVVDDRTVEVVPADEVLSDEVLG